MNLAKTVVASFALVICLVGCGSSSIDEKDSIEGQLKDANVGSKPPLSKGEIPKADAPN